MPTSSLTHDTACSHTHSHTHAHEKEGVRARGRSSRWREALRRDRRPRALEGLFRVCCSNSRSIWLRGDCIYIYIRVVCIHRTCGVVERPRRGRVCPLLYQRCASSTSTGPVFGYREGRCRRLSARVWKERTEREKIELGSSSWRWD